MNPNQIVITVPWLPKIKTLLLNKLWPLFVEHIHKAVDDLEQIIRIEYWRIRHDYHQATRTLERKTCSRRNGRRPATLHESLVLSLLGIGLSSSFTLVLNWKTSEATIDLNSSWKLLTLQWKLLLGGESCLKWGCFFMLPPLNCICHYKLRRDIKSDHGIDQGGCIRDALIVSFCFCCALIQVTIHYAYKTVINLINLV